MADEPDSVGAQAWRNKASYDYVLSLPRELLAVEFMRRNPQFEAAWSDWLSRQPRQDLTSALKVQRLRERNLEAGRWGLLTFPFRRK